MPHSREVRATSHDDHDPMLVAALAAGDLAATDRGLAADQIRTCADCALLHDDLLALTRATEAVPPPYASPARDFRLTPDDAVRLRPAGWRRFAGVLSRPRSGLSRNLGVGLATLGLAGLLVGNVRIDFGSDAAGAAPEAAMSAASAGAAQAPPATDRELGTTTLESQPSFAGAPAAASNAPLPIAAPAASNAAPVVGGQGDSGPASSPGLPEPDADNGVVPAASGPTTARVEAAPGDPSAQRRGATEEPARPLNLVFGGAVLVGLALVAASILRRRTAR